jgi:hypothetical protein
MLPQFSFGTVFYHTEGNAPNARTLTRASKYRIYYQCMVVLFASLRRVYPEARLLLVSNQRLPEKFEAYLRVLAVQTVLCPSLYVDDPCVYNAFPGCLFTLDALAHWAQEHDGQSDALILLDPDCIVLNCFDDLLHDAVEQQCMLAFEMESAPDSVINGQTRRSLSRLLADYLGMPVCQPIRYFGGEFYVVPTIRLHELAHDIDALWQWLKQRNVGEAADQMTEEHLLSMIFGRRINDVRAANSHVKRIWTGDNYNNVDGSEARLAVWHLPAEKKRGFVKLYRCWKRIGGFSRLDDAAFRALVERYIALYPNTRQRIVRRVRSHFARIAKALLRQCGL